MGECISAQEASGLSRRKIDSVAGTRGLIGVTVQPMLTWKMTYDDDYLLEFSIPKSKDCSNRIVKLSGMMESGLQRLKLTIIHFTLDQSV